MKLGRPNMRRLGVLLGLFFLASFTSYGQSAFTISGKVMEIGGGFVRATVRLFSADRVREMTANDYGSFEFTGVPPGVYDLEVSGEGWQTVTTAGVRVADKDVTQLSFTLQPGRGDGRCVIAISGSAAKASGLSYDQRIDETNLIGIALDPSGTRLSGASFTLSSSDRTWTAASDNEGVARFVGLQPGKYTLNLTHAGYGGESRPLRITRENLTRITAVLTPTGACR